MAEYTTADEDPGVDSSDFSSSSADSDAPEYTELTIDTDGDGVGDSLLMDLDSDGVVESLSTDTDGDSVFDTIISDTDADGIVDTMYVDTDGDGMAETGYVDMDQDGTLDVEIAWDYSTDEWVETGPVTDLTDI